MPREIESNGGKKWAITNEEFEKLATHFHSGYIRIDIAGLQIHANRIGDTDNYVCQGIGGFIGLSANHSDGWHIGTPEFATSAQLITAMQKITG